MHQLTVSIQLDEEVYKTLTRSSRGANRCLITFSIPLTLTSLLDVVSIDQAIGERGGELRGQHGLHLPDALIAACAERAGGDFKTKDPHFERLLHAGIVNGEVY